MVLGIQINKEFDEQERLLSLNKTNLVFVSGVQSCVIDMLDEDGASTIMQTNEKDDDQASTYSEKVSVFAVLANEVNDCDEHLKNGTVSSLKHWNKINQLHTAEKMIDSVIDLLHIEAKNNPVRILGFRADGGVLGLLASGVSTIIVFFVELMLNR